MRVVAVRSIVMLCAVALASGLAVQAEERSGRDGKLGPGRFLVAGREMLDPNFAKTVVLLIDHGPEGALGLVVNRPSELKLSALSSEIDGLRDREEPVYVGGPVPGGRIFLLIRGASSPVQGTREVIEGVHLSREQAALERLAEMPDSEFRVYAGYAGWAPGQLENEVLGGDWHILPAGHEWIFSPRPGEVWNLLLPPEPSRQAYRGATTDRDRVRIRYR